MECRAGCAACCTAISISSAIPGMPEGKPAGVRCINLGDDNMCRIHNTVSYPEVCRNFKASEEMCGDSQEHALKYLAELEYLTK